MSKHITDFAQTWVLENINAGPYDPGERIVSGHVEQLKADAAVAGISEDDLEEYVGDLHDYIAEALEEATDNEVDRRASKDD
ncbi:hypothetical protein MMA231_02535 [Asticcacaulis sp. MM231]|uniref:hypothetical protein n=1 Tax=Asticcacaulis sp. MM231 TaxID=3157666 RepID=UPI0032D596D0